MSPNIGPENDPPPQDNSGSQDFASIFSTRGIRLVRIQWVDLSSQIRCRVLPVPYFLKLLRSDRPSIALPKVVMGFAFLTCAPGFSPVGEHDYVVDLSSFRTCSYAPGHAVFFGFLREQVLPVPQPMGGPSLEVPFCPRTVLTRLIRYASDELGIKFLVGFESEFILLKSTNPLVYVNSHQYSTTNAFHTGTPQAQVLEECALAIQDDGIEVQIYHSEGAPGQYEISTGPMPPLEAADALVHTHETIYNIARKHGLRATFAPRLASDSLGTAAHTHVSVRSVKEQPGTSATCKVLNTIESAFLSGLMDHLPSVLAITQPLPVSYTRMVDGIWSGGTWVCWGADNREAPVRLTKPTIPSSRNFEIRPVDGTANPYLTVAGILACGILGVRENRALAVKNCDVPEPPAKMTAAEREALGITKRLPLNVEDARQRLAGDEAVKGLLGTEFVEKFLGVSEVIGRAYAHRDGETEAQTVARLVENY